MAKKVLTYHMSEQLPNAMTAKININTTDGNLTIDPHASGHELASGDLQYLENQGQPTQSLTTSGSQATFTLKSSSKGQPWFHFPWSACNGATEWLIHLSRAVSTDITAHTGGGNVKLDLTGMTVTRLNAETGGGNLEVVLPDRMAGLKVDVKTGAGNVTIQMPGGIAARVRATSGLGQVIMDAPLNRIDKQTYQSPDYDSAIEKIEITASSGAGVVSIKESVGRPEPAILV